MTCCVAFRVLIATGAVHQEQVASMSNPRFARTALALACMTLATVVAAAGPAAAEDPAPEATDVPVVETVAPPEPEESDLVEGAPTTQAPAPTVTLDDDASVPSTKPSNEATPDAEACVDGYRYYATSKTKDYHKGVGPTNSNYNGTSRTAKSTFTSEVTGKVGIAVSGDLNVSAGIAIAEVEAEFGVNVAVELTAKIGNTIAVETPPKTTTNARYGVYRLKSYGYSQYVYKNCTRGVKNNVTLYTPRKIGWYLWES